MTIALAILAAIVLIFIVIKVSLWLSDRRASGGKRLSASGAGLIHDGVTWSGSSSDHCGADGGHCGGDGH